MIPNSASHGKQKNTIVQMKEIKYPSSNLSCTINCGYLSIRKHAKLVTKLFIGGLNLQPWLPAMTT